MNKLILASLTGIVILAIATPTFAYKGNPEIQGPNYSPERHEAMEAVFEKGDYQGWLKLMEGKAWRLKEVVSTQEKFEAFSKAHEAGADELAKFRQENGLTGMGNGSRTGNQDKVGYGRNR
jgi:hypothetical protein